MHAIRLHSFGPPENLRLEELPDLTPAPGQVRIAVEASGVHLLDTTIRRGEPGPLPPPELPTVPGREVAGVVDRLGPDTDPAWLGGRVVAHLGPVPGGYADQAVTAEQNLFRVPDHVTFPEAVAAVGTGRTALGVVELEPATSGDVVLVLSAAGGLGWLLVQSALAAGARVVAAAGGSRTGALADLAAEAAAMTIADYADPGWATQVEQELGGVTLAYDGVGGDIGRAALELLRPGGRLVMFGFSAGTPTPVTTDDLVRRGISAGWSLGPRMAALPGGIPGLAGRALDRVATGEWRPLVSTFPLAEAGRAHAELEGRNALGKVVLVSDRQ
ncbi:MAG TPA: oxidoreductase [Nocardioides bacterium]|uniref:zinc-binding dehydrogenase n=1 Tax=uncultured Nocardioides sp. TaxID=198441 RepID=UPI000EF055C3|nr:zinc-binding dehydrogenase [uncultured Nocardioides sp.]HCB07679.1 oxidoreductase [Nocardioides sp.]